MEAIAREAGVGVGTLYRHFPKRIDVVEAVYRTDVDDLVATADQVVAELEPWPAVVAFLEAFVRYAQGKRTFLNELHEAFEKNPEPAGARARADRGCHRSSSSDAARRPGSSAPTWTGHDVIQLVGPMCTNATLSEDQSMRLLGMILDGLAKVG